MYPPNLNVPLPDPSQLAPEQTKPDKMQQALSLIAPLFALGTSLGGSPHAGAAFLHGAHQTLQRQDQERQVKAHQDAQLRMQQEQLYSQQMARQQQMAQAAEAAKAKLVMDTAALTRNAKTRDDYERIIQQQESIGGALLGMRPNSIRSAVPFMAPNANEVMANAATAFLKNPANAQAIEQGKLDGSILLDVQGDGIPIPVPVKDVLKAGGTQFDPQTGAPLVMPKGKTQAGGVQLDDEAFLGEVAKFEAEKKRPATAAERGEIAIKVKRMMEKPPAAPEPGTLTPKKQTIVNNISNAFRSEPIVKRTNTIAEAVSFVNSLPPNSHNPADDQAMIYAFAKAMDPESVVREGEYATVQKYAQSWIQTFGFNAARVLSNSEFLTPQARANMKATILKKYAATRSQYDNVRKGFTRQLAAATGGQVDPNDYLTDYAGAMPDPATGAAPKPQTFTVTTPKGTYTFPSQAQADAFKRASGIH